MNFYEYHGQDPSEQLEETAVYLAAYSIVEAGMKVIPLVKGEKEPYHIKDVYKHFSTQLTFVPARADVTHSPFDFHFKGKDVDLGLGLTDDMEFIDVDEKYKPGIVKEVLAAIKFGWPELYDKLVIHKTGTGGCHLIYRSEIVGGEKVLARKPSTPNPLAIIERISKASTQFMKIPPSQGYECMQGNPLSIQTITAEERNWLSAVCMSFNEVHEPEVKKKEAEREDSPWYVFNERNDWTYTRDQLTDRGWKVVGETDSKIIINRPGGTGHRSSGYIYKDISILYLHTTSTEFENGKAYSPFGVYAMLHHDGNIGDACKALADDGCGVNIYDEGEFWKRIGKGTRSKLQIKYTDLVRWLHTIGYRQYDGRVVQIIDNIITVSAEGDMIRAFLSEVEPQVRDEMYEKVPTIFKQSGGLMSMLAELDDNFINDTAGETWLFFRNQAIKVTATGHHPYHYKDLKGYIWKSEVIDRDFYGYEYAGCDAERFIDILGGDKSHYLQEIIGYLVSRYKDPMNPRAVIIMEDIEPEEEGESQGGSGKGMCIEFVKQFRKVSPLNGKNFSFSDPFLWQNVDPDTAVIFIDDVERSFRFNNLFSILTGSLLVNKKNKDQKIIEFGKVPKFVMTSNYSIGGMDASSRRRKYEFAVHKHFGDDYQPVDAFGRAFFYGWDKTEWLKFDNFIVHCCKAYIGDTNKKAIGNITGNSSERALIANTNRDFIEYMDGQLSANFFDFSPMTLKIVSVSGHYNSVQVDKYKASMKNHEFYFYTSKQSLYEKVQKLSHSKHLSTTKVTQWLKRWADSRGVIIETDYRRGHDGERCYRFVQWWSDDDGPEMPAPGEPKVGTEPTQSGNVPTDWTPRDDWDD
jgi:hypothetical protein